MMYNSIIIFYLEKLLFKQTQNKFYGKMLFRQISLYINKTI